MAGAGFVQASLSPPAPLFHGSAPAPRFQALERCGGVCRHSCVGSSPSFASLAGVVSAVSAAQCSRWRRAPTAASAVAPAAVAVPQGPPLGKRQAIRYVGAEEAKTAQALAEKLGLGSASPAVSSSSTAQAPPHLLRAEGRWSIVASTMGNAGGQKTRKASVGTSTHFHLDLAGEGLSQRLRRKLAEKPSAHPLYAALGRPLPGLRAIDCTGGFGSDALLMAKCFGLEVTVIEQNPLVFALLEDAALRAGADGRMCIGGRFAGQDVSVFGGPVLYGEAADILPTLQNPVDIVYLDPMFPRERRRKGRPDVAMQVLAAVTGEDTAAGGASSSPEAERRLLEVARRRARERVVVKRALQSPPMAGVRPKHQQVGTTNRFDIYSPL